MLGLMGTFAFMPLQDVVVLMARRKASGSLTCERGTVRKTLHVVEGVAVGASSTDPREYLGQLLMNFGHVDEDQLAKAFETQEATKVRLGKVLTMVGLVAPEIVRDTLAIKIRETLLDALVWDSGVFRVEDAQPPEYDELEARVSLEDIAHEAEFRATAWQAFRARFPTGTATLVVREGAPRAPIAGNGVDARLLELAREGKTIDEIGLALHATDFHLYQRLYALHGQGVVEAADPPAAAPAAPAPSPDGAGDGHDGALLRSTLLEPPCTPRLRVSARDVALMRLSAAEKYLLGRCDGTRNLRQIVRLAPLTEAEVLTAFRKFVDSRLVELA
jgi:hypothetical protein